MLCMQIISSHPVSSFVQPAVFAPCLREPDPPALDQFDLDEHFASEKLRLAQLTNKCHDDDDLEYYIKESGDILGYALCQAVLLFEGEARK